MGGFFAQTCPFALEELVIEFQGDATIYNTAPTTSAVLAGLLSSYMEGEHVNEVNAPFIAKQRGMKVRESKISEEADFSSLITLTAKREQTTHKVAGTIFGKGEPRLVRINDYSVESVPAGNILLIDNIDKPGVIGNLGTLMGARGINIGNMHVGRDKAGGMALCICHLDTIPSPEALHELESLPNVNSVKLIQLQ
jgi:D-3-phosphoglycerate dehydrogenase